MFKVLSAAAVLSLTAFAPVNAATVINGSFEMDPGTNGINNRVFANLPSGSGNGSWEIFASVPGWTTTAGQGVELQTKNTIPLLPFDGDYYAELDGNQNSGISQSITFGVGRYELTFAYSPRVNTNPNPSNTNQIDFGVTGVFSDGVSGPNSATPHGLWTVITREFTITAAGDYDLFFAAAGKSDSYGGFIDGIRLAAVPLPAGGLLLIGALGGLAALRRRKAQTA